jgi:hypothetical protein
MTEQLSFVYKWTHLPTLMWYVGSHTRKGSHPDNGYICSSKRVEPLILANPEEWIREIIETGEPLEMYDLETVILQTLNARDDPRSFNGHNNDGKFSGLVNKGVRKSEDHRRKLIAHLDRQNKIHRVGKPAPFKGKTHLESSKKLLSAARSGINGSNGWYVSPNGEKFETAMAAAASINKSHMTILRWVKNNMNGWKLVSKNDKIVDSVIVTGSKILGASESNEQQHKGEF